MKRSERPKREQPVTIDTGCAFGLTAIAERYASTSGALPIIIDDNETTPVPDRVRV